MVRTARFVAFRLARLAFALAGALVRLAAALIGFARPGADFGLVIEHRRETPRPLPFWIISGADDDSGPDPEADPDPLISERVVAAYLASEPDPE